MTIAHWIFWICAGLLLHHHLFYPLSLMVLARFIRRSPPPVQGDDTLPQVSVLLAVYNEEKVLKVKLQTTFETDYPADRLEVLIGSDASTDRTDELLQEAANKYPNLRWWRMPQRSGKAAVINRLAEQANGSLLVLTDANVMFTPATLRQLIQPFGDPQVGLVGGHIISREGPTSRIGRQESLYQRYENALKFYEGEVWGMMMGAFGGCYALRRELYEPVPPAVIVDDFFITVSVLLKGKKAVSEPKAVCYEDVHHSTAEEFRRKSRIATGNYQMLGRFGYLLRPRYGALAYVFFSHKVLRWIAPHLMAALYFSSFALASGNVFFQWIVILFTLALLSPALSWAAGRVGLSVPALRYISHYMVMNAAMLNGFFQYLNKKPHHVWKPTQRSG
ncbi:MAG: glycosyltransferase family 2 protein [Chitinophagales bacterium]|nr:glycosyltransferase family 2 protein [Chitinophagales bacterium]